MLPELNGIRLVAGADLRLRPGQTVALEVVRQVGARRWEVSLGGRKATVWSPFALAPGGAVRARVQRAGDPAAGVPALLRLLASPRASLLEKLQASGLPVDALSQRIVAALLNHGAPLDPHWIGRLRRAAVGREPVEQRRLRALVLLLDRGLDLQEEGTRRLLPLLEGGGWDRQPGSGHQDPGGGRGRPEARGLSGGTAAGEGPGGELAARLKEAFLRAGGAGGSPLQVFNHLRAGHGQWLVVPFRLRGRGAGVDGCLRLLLDPHPGTVRRLIVEAGAEGGEPWAFELVGRPGRPWRLRSVHGGEGPLPPELRKKLQNLGLEVDDIQIEYRDFDGFSTPGEAFPLQGIDTVR